MEESYNSGQMPEQNQNVYNYNTDYNQPTYQQNQNHENNEVMSMGEWFLTILPTMIPCLGLIFYLIWAFGNNVNKNRKNYCRAMLIYWIISSVLWTILIIVIAVAIAPALDTMSSGYYY